MMSDRSTPDTCTIACDVRPEVGLELHAPVCWQEQLAAEREARQEAEQELAETVADRLLAFRQADVAHERYLATLAQLSERDQQLAALREIGQSLIDHAEQGRDEAIEDRDEYKLVAKAATEYADVVLAQLAARDQQLAALREARDTLCECLHDVEPDDFRACEACWHNLDSAILALLAKPAGEAE